MNELNLLIDTEPKAQKRARATGRGKFIRFYDPSSGDKAEYIRLIGEQLPDDFEVFTGPLIVHVTYYMSRPKSHLGTGKNSNKLKASAPFRHIKKPDIDNLDKLLLDSMNGFIYKDDAQIIELKSNKKYSINYDYGRTGYVHVDIQEVK